MREQIVRLLRTRAAVADKLAAALRSLQALRVALSGPFVTPHKHRIYVVDGCILTESEVVVLHEGGKLKPERVGQLLSDLRYLQTPDFASQRRSQRVMLRLRLLVRAELSGGKHLKAQAFTVTVNAHGGLLELPSRMTVGQKITLINPQSKKEAPCRVVCVQGPAGDSFATAFEFEQRSAWFWPVSFPPLDWAVRAESRG
jgi:hypothetical protein